MDHDAQSQRSRRAARRERLDVYETNEASSPAAAGLSALVERVIAVARAGIDGTGRPQASRRETDASLTKRAFKKHRP
jgi:hypothetical protein